MNFCPSTSRLTIFLQRTNIFNTVRIFYCYPTDKMAISIRSADYVASDTVLRPTFGSRAICEPIFASSQERQFFPWMRVWIPDFATDIASKASPQGLFARQRFYGHKGNEGVTGRTICSDQSEFDPAPYDSCRALKGFDGDIAISGIKHAVNLGSAGVH